MNWPTPFATPFGTKVLPLIATLILSSCGRSEQLASGGAVIDTLANGAVRVVNTAEGIWGLDETERWVLTENLRIGVLDGEGPYVFGSVRNVFPATQGRIWVMDSQAFELRLFNPDGSFVRAVGKQGGGPGEFAGRSPGAFPGPNEEVWVEDSLRRWQRFNEEGRLVGSHRSTSNFGCSTRRWTPDGRFFVRNMSFDPGGGAGPERENGHGARIERATGGVGVAAVGAEEDERHPGNREDPYGEPSHERKP